MSDETENLVKEQEHTTINIEYTEAVKADESATLQAEETETDTEKTLQPEETEADGENVLQSEEAEADGENALQPEEAEVDGENALQLEEAEACYENAEHSEETEILEEKTSQAEGGEAVEEDISQTESISEADENTELSEDLNVYVDNSLFEAQKKKNEKKHKLKKICGLTALSLLGLMIIVYFSIAVWFMFHFNNKTIINGTDVSFQSVDDVSEMLKEYQENYELTVGMRNADKYVITSADINLSMTPDISESDIKHEQNGLLWPFYIKKVKKYDLKYTVTYDKNLLEAAVKDFDCLDKNNMEVPKDAYVEIKDGKPVVIEETKGTSIDYDVLLSEICSALEACESDIDLSESDCYKTAVITADSEEIANRVDSLNQYLDMVIHFKFDEVEFDLDADKFSKWMYYDKGWRFKKDEIHKYVVDLSEKYDTIGTFRSFRTYNGDYVEELGTEYGWAIDVESEEAVLKELLEQGETCEHRPEFIQEGAAYNSLNDIGYDYIEVDLTNQHVYVIIDGSLVAECDCVTGCVKDGNATPDGLYSIYYKKTPALLKGEDYETKVTYWMPFNGGIGLHDASWRGTFGGDIYMNGGSHGCVNLPPKSAAAIYNIIYPGMPVICYY